ncbi:hypothetical protein KC19_5G161400 [Ceratodon purpureus]|uniref:Uncharacterized protein n=1 Tax=Ceratodon purpureus TaxID=3225 RepID=A0A8T0I3I8_CERPU|nr:hypothetical protein KC19_5G161400 [Ceratodon purpureus]
MSSTTQHSTHHPADPPLLPLARKKRDQKATASIDDADHQQPPCPSYLNLNVPNGHPCALSLSLSPKLPGPGSLSLSLSQSVTPVPPPEICLPRPPPKAMTLAVLDNVGVTGATEFPPNATDSARHQSIAACLLANFTLLASKDASNTRSDGDAHAALPARRPVSMCCRCCMLVICRFLFLASRFWLLTSRVWV